MPWLATSGPAALYATAFVTLFMIVSVAIGRRILLWLGVGSKATLAERAVIAISIGAGVLQFLPFALGTLRVLGVSSVRIGSLIVALLAAPDAWAVSRTALARLKTMARPSSYMIGWLVALAPGLVVALLLAMTPTLDPDGLGYHLTVPKRWLAMGSLGYLPTYPYSNAPMGVEMLFTIGLAWGGDSAAKIIHYALGITGAFGLYAAGKRLGSATLGSLAVVAFLFGPFGVGSLLGFAYLEGATSCALIAAGLAWLVWFREREPNWLKVAGLLAGVSVSFKLTAALFPVALGALTAAIVAREAREEGRSWWSGLSAIFPLAPWVVLPVVPWLVRSTIVTGNPVFPMFAQIIPSRDFSPALSKSFDQYNRYMTWGIAAGASWSLGLRKMMLAGVAAVILVAGAVGYRIAKSFQARATVVVLFGTMLVQVVAAGIYKRYWVPILAILELPLLFPIATRLRGAWVNPSVIVLTGALSLVQARQSVKGINGGLSEVAKTALGVEDQQTYLRDQIPLFPLYEQVNRELAPDAGIMLAVYCGGFYIDRSTYCVDIVQESVRVGDWQQFTADLRRLGITHVLAPRDWEAPMPTDEPTKLEVGNVSMLIRPQEHNMVGQILRAHSRRLASAGDQGLYAIDLAGLADAVTSGR
jgi:hypothetical protein